MLLKQLGHLAIQILQSHAQQYTSAHRRLCADTEHVCHGGMLFRAHGMVEGIIVAVGGEWNGGWSVVDDCRQAEVAAPLLVVKDFLKERDVAVDGCSRCQDKAEVLPYRWNIV